MGDGVQKTQGLLAEIVIVARQRAFYDAVNPSFFATVHSP
jgi:hypothetical protein